MNGEDAIELVLGEWRTRSVGGTGRPEGVESIIELVVTDDGEHRVQGRGGVNRIGGSFELDGGEIVFGPFFTTLMAGPEPAMQHEHALLQGLSGRRSLRLDGDVMVIGEGDGEVVLDRVVAPPDDIVEVTGTVTYLQRIALAPGAVVTVRLSDVSRVDTAAPVVAEQVIEPDRQVPIPYTLRVNRSALDPRGRYSLSARITVDGRLRWTSDSHIPVAFDEPTTGIEILVRLSPGS